MIRFILKRLLQALFVLIISYTGNFVVVEEVSEKTEKTEKSEEALQSLYHSKKFNRAANLQVNNQQRPKGKDHNCVTSSSRELCHHDFNIDHMYYSSHLVSM